MIMERKIDFKRVQNTRGIIFFAFFALITFISYGWRLGTGNAVHSDETCFIFVGQDFLSGNFFLKDWWLSTGTFGLPTFELTVLTAIFGYHDTLIYVAAAMNYALMILAVSFVVYKYAKVKQMNHAWVYSAIVGLIIVDPRYHMHLHAGTQVLAYAVAILSLYISCTAKSIMKNGVVRLIWGIMLGFLAVTNNMFFYTACIPILLTGILATYENKIDRNKLWLVETGIISVGAYVIFEKLWECFRGSDLGGLSTTFTTRDKIWDNLIVCFCNILELYGIDFWGENLFSLKTVSALVGFLVLAKISIEIYRFIKNSYWKDEILFNAFFLMALVNFGAYAFSTVVETAPDVHLLQPFLLGYTIAGSLAWIKNAEKSEEKSGLWKALGVSISLMILLWPNFTLQQPDNSGRQQAAQYLVENGYEKGFATYWSAASVMYESEGKLTISPVCCYSMNEAEKPTLHVQQWMNKEEWITQEGHFLVLDSTSEAKAGVNVDGIIATFGEWTEMRQFGDITVYTWDEPQTLN